MGKKSKIKPTEAVSYCSDKIKPTMINDTAPVSFNFKRLNNKAEKFKYTNSDSGYFLKLLERLRDISRMNRKEMMFNNKNALRCHPIDFTRDKVSESTFGIMGEDVDKDAWQFQLSSNEHGRVHGYFVGNTFYVVWLDPLHELYSGTDY